MGKPSTIRYKAMLAEIDQVVTQAVQTGKHNLPRDNPYDIGDKRYTRFAKTLQHRLMAIAVFDM